MLYLKLKKLKKGISKEIVNTKSKVEVKAENGVVKVKEEVITAEESEKQTIIVVEKKALTDVFIVRIHIYGLRESYKQFCRDFINRYKNYSRKQPVDIIEVNSLIEYFKPIISYKKKMEETSSSQYFTEGSRNFKCFKCKK